MSKIADQVKPNYGPMYAAALYPDLARIFIDHGYALAVHGSLARDLDLIAVPWTENPAPIAMVLEVIQKTYAVTFTEPGKKNHGRIAHTVCFGFGHCAVDLSVFPGGEPC